MSKRVIRFAVGNSRDTKSSVWRLWVQGDEVYLGAQDSLQAVKVSLHKSGIWRIAFVKELIREDEASDRLIMKWKRPAEFTPGWTGSVAVLMSSIQPNDPFEKLQTDDNRVNWFTEPAQGNCLKFKVLISSSAMTDIDLKKIMQAGDKLGGRINKRNGEVVWLIVRESRLTPIEVKVIRDVMNGVKIRLALGSSEKSIKSRAWVFNSENNPSVVTQPTIFDISLGKENLEKISS